MNVQTLFCSIRVLLNFTKREKEKMETVERHKPEAICIPSIPNDLENGVDSDPGMACTPPVCHQVWFYSVRRLI